MEMDFQQEVCRRLPLADAMLRLGQFVLRDEHSNEIFQQHRGRSYGKVISFPSFVNLIGDALLEHDGNGHQALTRALEEGGVGLAEANSHRATTAGPGGC
jgi:hypothetical protein